MNRRCTLSVIEPGWLFPGFKKPSEDIITSTLYFVISILYFHSILVELRLENGFMCCCGMHLHIRRFVTRARRVEWFVCLTNLRPRMPLAVF